MFSEKQAAVFFVVVDEVVPYFFLLIHDPANLHAVRRGFEYLPQHGEIVDLALDREYALLELEAFSANLSALAVLGVCG